MRDNDRVRRWLPVLAAFLLGVGLVSGVGVAHDGSGQLLHSGHSDSMNGTLTAKNFKYKSAKVQNLVLGASSFMPNSHTCQYTRQGYGGELQDSNGCAGYTQDFSLPKGARITKVTWFYDPLAGGDPTEDATLRVQANEPEGAGGSPYDQVILLNANELCDNLPCSVFGAADHTVGGRHYSIWLDPDSDGGFVHIKTVIQYRVPKPS